MTETVLPGAEFDRDVARAKRAAADGPVIITEHGKPAYVLLRHDDYQSMAKRRPSLHELLVMSDGDDIDFDPPKLNLVLKPAEFD